MRKYTGKIIMILILALCTPVHSAELLIYNKDHWMDALTPQQLIEYNKKYPSFQAKYDARYQRGDIVEVREDGFYTSTLKGDTSKWAFRVVVVEGLNADNMYVEPTLTKRRRFNIMDGATKTIHTVSKIEDITLTDKTQITAKNEHEKDILLIAHILMFCNLG